MAIKSKLGHISGSDTSPQIAVTVWNDSGAELDFLDAMNAAINAAPSDISGIPISGVPTIQSRSLSAWTFGVSYSHGSTSSPPRPEPPETGSVVRTANFNAKSVTLFNFLEPVGVYNGSGDVTSDYQYTKWKIDSFPDGDGHYVSQGTSFDPLPETRTLRYYIPNASLTETYLDTIEAIVGHFNDGTWRGRAQGSVQLVRFSANERSADDWELEFGFGYKPPQTNISVNGDIVIPNMRGSWYYWTFDRPYFNATANILERAAELAVVGRVWEESDFDALDLPA